MTSITRRLFLSLAAALAPGAALAHHGWGSYDTSKSFTAHRQDHEIDLRKSALRDRDGGRRQALAFRAGAAFAHAARGITPELIAVGKTCTVFGYPHTSKPDEARIEYIVLDGKRIELR